MMQDDAALKRLSAARWRAALGLTAVMLVIYFGFICLAAYAKPLMGRPLVSGLSLGILLGALVIIAAFALTGVYVRWANAKYDPELRTIRDRQRLEGRGGEGRP